MKNIYLLILSGLFCINNLYSQIPGRGEFKVGIVNSVSNQFNLAISTSEYSWDWINYTLVPLKNYYRNYTNVIGSKNFDAPKDKNAAIDSIAWGIFNITVESISPNFSRTFTLDMRDENWSQGTTYSNYQKDTYLIIDQSSQIIYLKGYDPYGNIVTHTISDGDTINIWDFLQIEIPPDQSNFKIPLTLSNRVENYSSDFGYLVSNNVNKNSGDTVNIYANTQNNIMQGTSDTAIGSERKYSFDWTYNNVAPSTGTNIYQAEMNYSIDQLSSDKSITRNFRTVWPLTIKNDLIENGSISADSIYFKDPTTDNQFHNYNVSGSGFIKNEAFDSLSIIVNNNPEQKYSVLAKSFFNYGGSKYCWYSGDFNPTNQTDLSISNVTTLTANYKGVQISNNSNAIANNSQRKIVRTPDGYLHIVYESLGHVWLETSQDNGATWQLMNNGLPLDNGQGKLPSIDWSTDSTSVLGPIMQLLVIYQEQSSTGYVIKLKLFEGIDGGLPYLKDTATIDSVTNDTYSTNVNPAISYDKNHVFMAVWERKAGTAGLYFRAGAAQDNYGITFSTSTAIITGTSSSSENPAIAVCKGYGQTTVRQLAWDESNTIQYAEITPFGLSGTIQNISSGDGFTLNYNPSVIALTDTTARVCWAGDLDGTGSIVQAVFHDPGNSRYWGFRQRY